MEDENAHIKFKVLGIYPGLEITWYWNESSRLY